ncbi:DegV family protein [Streptococcus anginosus]|uniref:DegV family protein n=1 Tax=Streptococcus anginosus TaxID=1328 RepID=A0ABD4U194_STRAP|nr:MULTISPECIES: DegV family protein [Streptococcus]KAA9294946.1 DegV family protein [Streptococcus anginosus]KUM00853.1 fatty acid-binding protein DegV [Streptococcus anginosus]MCW1059750.1 DegV family protein [Streptococcus anginosus]MCW1075573.1 DegV family protein [Streptococcus anginosus]MDB8655274.1 DegV family protein [Streptococcus anginosus]
MTWKIVADSGCDYRTIENLAVDTLFESVPLTIQVGDEIFIDNAQLNIDDMMEKMYATSSASKSACPSPDDYMKAFDGASNIFVVTITGTLSGSHNSAQVAKKLYIEEHPNVNIHIIDTLSAGGENDLIIKNLNLLIGQGLSYEEVVTEITAYQAKTKLLFVLAKVDNLVKNGRLSKLLGAVVGLLNIRMVGEASQDGKLELLQKARGAKKSLIAAFDELIKAGYAGGQIIIAHRNNLKFCQQFSEMVRERFPQAVIEVIPTSGLCSFYAEENGLLMGYEIQ